MAGLIGVSPKIWTQLNQENITVAGCTIERLMGQMGLSGARRGKAFIIDVFSRMIVGWQTSRSLQSDLAIDALEMAVWNRQRVGQDLTGLKHHSARGRSISQHAYSERLADNAIVASVGSKGDSYDCEAMAESFNGLYKWELIHRQGQWRGLDDVEFATMTYIDWFNHRRLHGEITNDANYTTPAEH